MDIFTQDFSEEVFERLDIPRKWFTTPTNNGAVLRQLSPRITQELKVDPFDVIAELDMIQLLQYLRFHEHEKGTVFISCGTWSLVGTESTNQL